MLIILSLHCQMDATHSDYRTVCVCVCFSVTNRSDSYLVNFKILVSIVDSCCFVSLDLQRPSSSISLFCLNWFKTACQLLNYFCLDNKFSLKLLT